MVSFVEDCASRFCGTCGSTLFWDPIDRDWTAVAMGAFDGPTGTSLAAHILFLRKATTTNLQMMFLKAQAFRRLL